MENDSKKHAKKGNASKIGSAWKCLEMPPWVPLRIKNQNQIQVQIQAQVRRTVRGPRDTPLRAAHGGGYIYIYILVRPRAYPCTEQSGAEPSDAELSGNRDSLFAAILSAKWLQSGARAAILSVKWLRSGA